VESTVFIVEETTGEQRMLRLLGRAGPYRPVEFDGEQRFEVTWNPGCAAGTVQVLGAKEGSTTIQGSWKLRYLSDPDCAAWLALGASGTDAGDTRLYAPIDIVSAVDLIRRAGQVLRVQWADIVRRGMLKRFKHRWERVEDVYWEMEFEWISQDDVAPPVASPGVDATQVLADFGRVLQRLRGELDAARQTVREWYGLASDQEPREDLVGGAPYNALSPDAVNLLATPGTGGANVTFLSPAADKLAAVNTFADTISGYDSDIQGAMNEWADTINAQVDGILSPVQAARRFVDTCGSIIPAAENILARNEAVVTETLFRVSDSVLLAVGEVLAVSSATRPAASAALALRNQAADAKNRFLRQIEPQVRAVHTAREGENLRDVSLQYYGTQDHWIDLMDYNGLEDSVLTAGQVVFIPRQFAGTAAAA